MTLCRGTVDATIAELEPLVEVSHATQIEISRFRDRYDRIGKDAPLPPGSLRQLDDGRRRYLKLQDRLTDLAKRFAPLAESGAPVDVEPLLRYQALSISLIAGLTLYDNYLSLLTLIKDDRLRRLVAHPTFGYGIEEDALWKIIEALNEPETRRTLRALCDAWRRGDDELAPTDDRSNRLRSEVETSVAYRFAQDASLRDGLPTEWRVRRTRFLDELRGLGEQTVGAISKAFGNGIGLVEVRKGKLWRKPAVTEHLLGLLQPLDLLLEKTPFRLTDLLIPGHFGHVAIWMGSDQQLDTLHLWAQPAMREEPLHSERAQVRDDHSVLEALRTGVELNTLKHFLNVDDLAVLRPRRLRAEEVVESLIRGFRQVGKEYDFNFDVETTGSIVCSELPYHVYPGVVWRTESKFGRFTISPDDVAAQALSGTGAFELITFYHDGKLVDSDNALERMTALMRA